MTAKTAAISSNRSARAAVRPRRGFLTAASLVLSVLMLSGAARAQIGGPIPLGELPDGKKVRVHFDVTVKTGLGPLVMAIENQGTVASSSMAFGAVPTDDPADATSEVDFTVTPLDGLTIGNLVWNEKTGNAVFDPATTDVGIVGVLVNLYLDDGDGLLDAGDGAPIATDTTAAGGIYGFTGLQPGDYLVEVPACNFVLAPPCVTAPLAGFASLAGAVDPENTIDNDDNGDPVATFGVATAAVTLSFGDETPGDEDGDSDADTNLTVDLGFAEVADLAIDKSDSGMNAVAGATYTYTIKITNNGPGASSGSTVTDTLPSGWTFVSSTGTCAGDGMSPVETVTCTVGALAASGAGAMTSFDITAMVPSNAAAATVTNSASVVGAQVDLVAGNNSDSEMTTVVIETDLAIDKSDSGMDVAAGDTYVYTLKVTNNGPSDSTGGSVTDTLPSGWTFVSATGGTCVGDGMSPVETVTCTVGALAPTGAGATQTFLVTVSVPSSAAAGTVTNSASVAANETDSTAANDSDSEMTTVVLETDLAIDKSDSGLDANAGANYVYTLEVTNNGPSDSTGGSVTDTLPAGWTFVSATGGTCVGDGGSPVETVTCTVGALADGAMQTFLLTVAVPGAATAGTVTNSASVAANETDPVAGNDSDTEMTTVVAQADLAIDKSDSGLDVVPGSTYAYTIKVTNLGPGASTGSTVTDPLPSGWTFVSSTGTCVGNGMSPIETVTCTVGALAFPGMASFDITVMVPSSEAPGTVTNTATVAGAQTDPVAGNNSDSEMTTVAAAQADLSITKTDSPDPVKVLKELTYTIVATNNGPSDAANLEISDPLPPNTTFVSAAPSAGGACTTPAVGGVGTVTCTWAGATGASGAAAVRTLTLVVKVELTATDGSTISNTASTSSDTTDPGPSSNDATELTTVINQPDLSIDKDDGVTTAVPGTSTTYTITVNGSNAAEGTDVVGATVTDLFPPELACTWTCAPAGGAACTAGPVTGDINDTVDIPAGDSVTYTAVCDIDPSAAPTLSNTATVSPPAGVTDPIPANDSSTDVDTLTPMADLSITKTDSPDPANFENDITYTIVATNNGPSDAADLEISDPVPPDTTFVSATPSAGGACTTPAVGGTGTVTCTWAGATGTSGAAAERTLTLVVKVDATAPSTISNTASTSSATPDPGPLLNDATEETDVRRLPTFTKVFAPDTIGEGFETTLTFTIDNALSAFAATALVFTDTLPFPLRVADAPSIVNNCGGTVTAAAGLVTIDLVGGTVGAGVSCTISVAVFAPSSGVVVNETDDLTSSAGNSGTATDTLTVLPCLAVDGANLVLGSDVVLATETYEVCNTVTVEPHYLVLGPDGVLTLRAGSRVVFFNGVEIGANAELVVDIDPGLIP